MTVIYFENTNFQEMYLRHELFLVTDTFSTSETCFWCGGLGAPAVSELQITKYGSITSCRACAHQAKVVDFSAVPSTLS